MVRIAILGDFNPESQSHAATNNALRHASDRARIDLESAWLRTDAIDLALLEHVSALWVAPGSPYADMEKVLTAIRFARERALPCLGTCGGFQHMVIEYARNVLAVPGATHAEYEPGSAEAFITPLACSLAGRSMTLTFAADSQVAGYYGSNSATEQYFCSLGVDPARVAQLKSGPLRVSGSDSEGEIRVIELPDHPFFIGSLFLPQMRSLPGRPHPLISAFVRAAAKQSKRAE